MGKKNKLNWQRNLPLSEDKSYINTWHHFVPDDFDYFVPKWLLRYVDERKVDNLGWDPPLAYKEICCRLLNFWRIEYVSLRNNGEPKKSYKPEVAEKINSRKMPRLINKRKACDALMYLMGMKLKDGFDRLDKNSKPRFNYDVEEVE